MDTWDASSRCSPMLLAAAGEGTQVSCWHWSGIRKRSNLRTGLALWCSSRVKWLHVVRYPSGVGWMGQQWAAPGQAGGNVVTQPAVSSQTPHRLSLFPAFSDLPLLNTSSRGCIGSEAFVKGEEKKKKEATRLQKLHQNNCPSSFMC